MPDQGWYSVRSVFLSERLVEGKPTRMSEERVVLFRASSFEEALAKGGAEAKRYAEGWPQPKMLDHLVAFSILEEELHEGEEVWSCLRESSLSDTEFLHQVYGQEMRGLRDEEQSE